MIPLEQLRGLVSLAEDIDRLETVNCGHVYGFQRTRLDQWKRELRERLRAVRAVIGPDPEPGAGPAADRVAAGQEGGAS